MPMHGMVLYDALTVASRRMNRCCVKTMNFEIGERPKATHVKVEGSGDRLTITVDCPVCKTRNVITTDGDSAKVDRQPGAAGGASPEPPPAH